MMLRRRAAVASSSIHECFRNAQVRAPDQHVHVCDEAAGGVS